MNDGKFLSLLVDNERTTMSDSIYVPALHGVTKETSYHLNNIAGTHN